MNTSTIVWIVVAVVVLLALLALALFLKNRSTSKRGQKAQAIREETRRDEVEVRKREAESDRMKAEADLKAAESDELAAAARDRERDVSSSRGDITTRYERADKVDPRTTDDDGGESRKR
jgi:Flp pilus assembly protein TadB